MKNKGQITIRTLEVNSQNPYIGLESYKEEYKDFFFGRSDDVTNLLKLIKANSVTVLSGKSGLGKTSLIKAGLVPELRKMDFLPIYLRLNFDNPNVGFLELVKKSIVDQSRAIDPSAKEFKMATLWEYFHQLSLLNGFVEPVLIFDQFEELFTRGEAQREQVERFINELSNLIENQIPVEVQEKYEGGIIPMDPSRQNYRIVLSLREDYLAKLETLSLTIPSLKKSRYRLLQMNQDQALEAILMPGREIINEREARYIMHLLFEIANTPQEVRNDIALEVEPFLLSLVCYQINNLRKESNEAIITSQLLEKIKVKNIIEKFYESSVAFMIEKGRNLLEEKLLTTDGFRKLQPKIDLIEPGILDDTDIEILIDKRVLRKEIWSGREHVELIHDVLVPIIRKKKSQIVSRKKKKLALIYAGIFLIVIVTLISSAWGIYAFQQRSIAVKEQAAAEEQRAIAVREKAIAEEQRTIAEDLLTLANKRQREIEKLNDSLHTFYLKERISAAKERELQKLLEIEREKEARTEEFSRTEGQFELLKEMSKEERDLKAEGIINLVASYLWSKGEDESISHLILLLKQYEDLIPENYGITPPMNQIPLAQDENWPLTLVISTARDVSLQDLLAEWQVMSSSMASSWGIPTPSLLRIEWDNFLPADEFIIKIPRDISNDQKSPDEDFNTLTFKMPERADYVLVTRKGLNERLEKFFNDNEKDWVLITNLPWGGPWYLVPKWTQPIFEVGGHHTSSAAAGIAVVLANTLVANPEYLLNDNVVKILLKNKYKTSPHTISEAISIRGGIDGIKKDLTEMVRMGHSLVNLEYHLSFLSNYWNYDSESAAIKADEDQQKLSLTFENLQGQAQERKLNLDSLLSSYDRTADYSTSLNYIEYFPKIRIHFGNGVEDWLVNGKQLKPEVLNAMDKLRADVYHRVGIISPPVKFSRTDDGLANDEIRIACLNQDLSNNEETWPITLNSSNYLAELTKEMKVRVVGYRIYWIDAEYVAEELNSFNPNLKRFFYHNYTLTDLKQIFRAVVSPEQTEIEYFADNRDEDAFKSIPNQHTLFDLKWLLGSMVFWKQTGIDHLNLHEVRNALVNTQRARVTPEQNLLAGNSLASLVQTGISEILNDNIEAAESSFLRALSQNRTESINAFLTLYPSYSSFKQQYIGTTLTSLAPKPGSINKTLSSRREQYDVLLVVKDCKEQLSDEDFNTANLILLNYHLEHDNFVDADTNIDALLNAYYEKRLSVSHQYLTGYYCLLYNKKAKGAPIRLDLAVKMLTESIAVFPENGLRSIYAEMVELVKSEFNDYNWSAEVLIKLAKLKRNFWANYHVGHYLSVSKPQFRYSETGLELLGVAKRLIITNGNGDQALLMAWTNFAEGYAYYNLAKNRGNPKAEISRVKGIRKLEELSNTVGSAVADWPKFNEVYRPLYGLYLINNEIEKAARLIDRGLELEPNSVDLTRSKIFILIAQKKIEEAVALAERMYKANPTDHSLFELSLTQILAGSDNIEYTCNKFFGSDHPYKDYIRMLVYYYLAASGNEAKGRGLLEKRWSKINPSTWRERMEQGDTQVWREKLIGYYLGHLTEAELFKPLLSLQAFEADPISKLGFSFANLQCEAFYYNGLLKGAQGNREEFVKNLRTAQSTKVYEYYEYQMANFLLEKVEL